MPAMQMSPETTARPAVGSSADQARPRTRGGRPAAKPGGSATERQKSATRQKRRAQLIAWAFLAPVVIYLLVFYAFPLLRNLDLSFRDYNVAAFVSGNAQWVWFDNYVSIITDPTFAPALLNTAIFTIVSIVFQFSIGLALAVFFYRSFKLSGVLRALFLVPWLLPLLVSASTWSWMLNSDSGVINSFLNALGLHSINWLTSPHWALTAVLIANIWIGIPFNLVILYSGLQNIPGEVYEASEIDGANAWQRFWRITFPLLRPVSAITILLGLVYTLKVFDIIWIMTRGGPGSASTTFAIWAYQLGFGSTLPDFSPAAAVGNLLIVIAFVFGLIYIRVQRRMELS